MTRVPGRRSRQGRHGRPRAGSNPLALLAGEVADTLVEVFGTLIDAHRWDLAAPLLADMTGLRRLLVLAGSDEHVEFLQTSLQLSTYYDQLDPQQAQAQLRAQERRHRTSDEVAA